MGSNLRDRPGAIIGIGLVAVGLLALAVNWTGVGAGFDIGDAWPILVIVPGLALFAVAFTLEPPRGLGFAIAGAIISMVGIVLWAQQITGRYDTWAYVWALVGPGGAGIGLLVYGLATGTSHFVRKGVLFCGIALAVFAFGAWYFEPVLTEGRQPVDLGSLAAIFLIVAGGVLLVSTLLGPRHPDQIGRESGPVSR